MKNNKHLNIFTPIVLLSGLAIKNPPKKTRLFYWVLLFFLKLTSIFCAKVTIFLIKCLWKSFNLCCNEYETLILIPIYIIQCSNLISLAVVVTLICRIKLTKRSMFFLLKVFHILKRFNLNSCIID
jgi:hypothetical protein